MKTTRGGAPALLLRALIIGALCGCASIAPFSQTAYLQATSIKAQALLLMDKATAPYDSHASDVDALKLKMAEAFEYAHGRPKNDLSARQWEIMRNPDGHLLGGFLQRWQKEKHLGAGFIDEEKKLVADGFDEISGLESGKHKSSGSGT
jgi:hypothetical protein